MILKVRDRGKRNGVESFLSRAHGGRVETDTFGCRGKSGERGSLAVRAGQLAKTRDRDAAMMVSRDHRENRGPAVRGVVLVNDGISHHGRSDARWGPHASPVAVGF